MGFFEPLKGRRAQLLSRVQLFEIPWTVAHQAPPSVEFPGKDTGVGCHRLLQGIFPAQGSNSHLPYQQADSLPPRHLVNKYQSRIGWKLSRKPSI